MIINSDYFLTKAVYIPNVVAQPSIGGNTPSALSTLTDEIEEKEAELLLAALGYEQFAELMAQFNSDGTYVTTPVQKWVDLVDGKEYNGKKWKGLRYEAGDKKISLIAYYVFFYYLQEDFTTYSTTGIQAAKAENSVSQTPNQKQAQVWNKFVDMYNGDSANKPSLFTNWNGTGIRWGSANNANQVSLYRFLSDNSDVYDTSFFTFQSVINPYNL